jgi:tRNA U34 5-methylaminomethyl-2-thiouridine-forming methyltransferase MnmC
VAVLFPDRFAQELEVGGAPDEGHGDEVHVAFTGELEVGVILLSQGGESHIHAWQVDVAAAAQEPGRQQFADEFIFTLHDGLHAEQAVVDDDDPAHVLAVRHGVRRIDSNKRMEGFFSGKNDCRDWER